MIGIGELARWTKGKHPTFDDNGTRHGLEFKSMIEIGKILCNGEDAAPNLCVWKAPKFVNCPECIAKLKAMGVL